MRARILFASTLAVLVALAALPTVAPQSTEAKLLILHDVGDDGYTYVGNPNQFAFLMLTAEGTTTVHKQGKILITQNDVKLYETLGGATGFDGAHDYDAFNGFLFAFPTTGPYTIHAEIPNPPLKADFTGYVREVPNAFEADLKVTPPSAVQAGNPAAFTIEVQGKDGKLVPHTDAIFEVRRASDNFLVFRTHTHSHDGPMKLEYRFAEAGSYVVRVLGYTAYPEPEVAGFHPISRDLTVQVGPPASGLPAPALVPATGSQPAPSGKYVIHATYDPDDMAGPFGNVRLNAIVLDQETRTQASHVDFKATLTDPSGRIIFRSETLHEYDGDLEVLSLNSEPGDYRMVVDAEIDGWKATKVFMYSIVKPTATGTPLTPYSAGPIIVDSSPLTGVTSGVPTKLEFSMKNLAGAAHQHSEIDLQIHGKTLGVPLLQNKLHTHADGKFAVDYTFPTAGDYQLVLDAESVHGDFTPNYHYKQVGGKLVVPVKVAQGTPLPEVAPLPTVEPKHGANGTLAAPGAFAFLAAVVAALVVARRQA